VIGLHLFFLLIFKETDTIKKMLNTLIIFDIFWAIISIADALRGVFHHATAKFNPDLAKEMGNFILKILEVWHLPSQPKIRRRTFLAPLQSSLTNRSVSESGSGSMESRVSSRM